MATKKQKKTDLKAKQKRQKIMLVVGGVLLLALLAYQLPRTMKMMKQVNGGAAATTAATTTTSTPASTPGAPAVTPPADGSLTAPTLAGGGTATTASGTSGGLPNSDPQPSAAPDQLVSIDRFASKDPFNQQVDAQPTSPQGSKPPAGTSTTPGSAGAVPPGGTTTTPAPPAATTPAPAPPAPPATATTATISVNGVSEDVTVGGAFPAAQPFFKLVSLTPSAAKIGIAGGSLATGMPTVTLDKGKKLTLMNTADGTRYQLQLVATK